MEANGGQKAFEMATDLDNLVPIDIDGTIKPRVEHWCGKIPGCAHHLHKWGESGVVKIKDETTPKLADCVITCMMVGHAKQHSGDCHQMVNMNTKKILETSDDTTSPI